MGLCYSSPIKLGYTIPGIRYFLWMCIGVCNIWKREWKGPPRSDPSFGEGLGLGNSDWRSKIKFYFLYISYIICTSVFKKPSFMALHWIQYAAYFPTCIRPSLEHYFPSHPWPSHAYLPHHTRISHPSTASRPLSILSFPPFGLLIFILQSSAQTSLALEIGC